MADEDFEKTLVCEAGNPSPVISGPDSFATVCTGCVVGNFRILKPLSEGGMGKIFLCHPLDDFNARYVLKVLKSELRGKGSGKERFRREYKLLHDYFGRGGNDVMMRLRDIASAAN